MRRKLFFAALAVVCWLGLGAVSASGQTNHFYKMPLPQLVFDVSCPSPFLQPLPFGKNANPQNGHVIAFMCQNPLNGHVCFVDSATGLCISAPVGGGCLPAGLIGVLQASNGAGGCQDTAITEIVPGPGQTVWNAVSSSAGLFYLTDIPVFSGPLLFVVGCEFSVAGGTSGCGASDVTTGRTLGFQTLAGLGFSDTAATSNTCAAWDGNSPPNIISAPGAVPCPTVAITTADKNRTCMVVIGADNGAVLADADIGPQGKLCQIPVGAVIFEIDAASDNGTPTVQVEQRVCGVAPCNSGNETALNLMSAVLTVAAAGGTSCSRTVAVLGLDGMTTCSATLQNNTIAAGTWLGTVSGTAGGVAARMSVAIHFTVN